jgi:hypothetical protein
MGFKVGHQIEIESEENRQGGGGGGGGGKDMRYTTCYESAGNLTADLAMS